MKELRCTWSEELKVPCFGGLWTPTPPPGCNSVPGWGGMLIIQFPGERAHPVREQLRDMFISF